MGRSFSAEAFTAHNALREKRLKENLYFLSLTNIDPMKGWLLELSVNEGETDEEDKLAQDVVEHFKNMCYSHLGRESHWFHQGTNSHWQLFEFWTKDQDAILEAAIRVANKCGMTLDL